MTRALIAAVLTLAMSALAAAAPPFIGNVNPPSGSASGGYNVVLAGSFDETVQQAFVNNINAPIVGQTSNFVTISVPASNVIGAVPLRVVDVMGQNSNVVSFTYTAMATGVMPNVVPTGGATVTISGNGLQGATQVLFDSVSIPFSVISGSEVEADIPAGEGSNLSLQVRIGSTLIPAPFVSYSPPFIASLNPASTPAGGGAPITLSGSNFGLTPSVTVDGVPGTITDSDHGSITFTAPNIASLGPKPVRVIVGGQLSNIAPLQYTASITNVSPQIIQTTGGESLTISGAGLAGATSVTIGGANAPIDSASNTEITVTTPAGEGVNKAVIVQVPGGTPSGSFSVDYAAPMISSVMPTTGHISGGFNVTIDGANFGLSPIVTIGGQVAPISASSHAQIVVTAPPSPTGTPTSTNLVLTVAGQMAPAVPFQYTLDVFPGTVAQVVTGERSTAGGDLFAILGTDLDLVDTVTIGGAIATIEHVSADTVLARSPSGQGASRPIVVGAFGATVGAGAFSYDAPHVTGLSKHTGSVAGGDEITVFGSDFGASPAVFFGGASATVLESGDGHARVLTPAGSLGGVFVTVTSAGQTSTPSPFTYLPIGCNTDISGNGVVDFADLNALLSAFGLECDAAP